MRIMRINKPALWSWNPSVPLLSLQAEMDRLLGSPIQAFNQFSGAFTSGYYPSLDLYEAPESYTVKTELPGVSKDQIEIQVEDGVLHISGELRAPERSEDTAVHRNERFHGQFHRSITLEKAVVVEKVKAAYEDGILTVTLPKAEEAKPKQIKINLN